MLPSEEIGEQRRLRAAVGLVAGGKHIQTMVVGSLSTQEHIQQIHRHIDEPAARIRAILEPRVQSSRSQNSNREISKRLDKYNERLHFAGR